MESTVIAGSGPAGLTAALYAARADLNPIVVEGLTPGGQLTVTSEVENYPGFPEAIPGMELMLRFRDQAARFGTRFVPGSVDSVQVVDGGFALRVNDDTIETRTLIIATGAEARRLPETVENGLYGRGISGCATCDGAFYRNRRVLVIGGGNTAVEDAVFLTRFASAVTVVHRRAYFRATPVELQKARSNPKVSWMVPWVMEKVLGTAVVEGAVLKNVETGETRKVACDGVFVAIGHDPKTEVFRDIVELDEHGFVRARPGSTETSRPGVFACGDVRDPTYKQAVLAAGHGCMAALDAQRYLGARE
jgi:thioredoxin reductase (NADPH)